MEKTIDQLPTPNLVMGPSAYRIFTLDDYSVHVQPTLGKRMKQKGYARLVLSGGITGDVQPNDTGLHHAVKRKYRQKEADLMLKQLQADPSKIPSPSREEMMTMFNEAYSEANLNEELEYKRCFMTNNFDGSEASLVSTRLYEVVGEEMVKFRQELLSWQLPKTLNELLAGITPPRGVKIPTDVTENPPDEGSELIDEYSADEVS